MTSLTNCRIRSDNFLFATQLGGGTDINRALGYCQTLVRNPQDTILVLISDLYEGGNREQMLRRAQEIVGSGVQTIALLALNDDGAPAFDHAIPGNLSGFRRSLHLPARPINFQNLMAAAIQRQDLFAWTAAQGITTALKGPQ